MSSLRQTFWFAALALVFAVTSGASAQVSGRRAALVSPGPELERATRTALEPWRVKVVILTEPSLGATAPRVNEAARDLAQLHDFTVVVWISEHERGHALWVYDRAADHVVARPLTTAPPFDAPTAAAVALSIKTLLRHSAIAPASERYGAATQAPEPAPEPVEPRRGAEFEPRRSAGFEPRADGGLELRREAGSEPRREAGFASQQSVLPRLPAAAQENAERAAGDLPTRARASRIAPSYLDLEAAAGMRSHFTGSYAPEARFGAGATWWPRARDAGLSLRVALGPPAIVASDAFRGHLFDTSVGLLGRLRRDVLARMRVFAGAGVAGEVTLLRGRRADAPRQSRTRAISALTMELGADWLVTAWFKAGVRAGGAWLINTQRYEVNTQRVLTVSSWTLEGALVLAVCLGQ